ncbi:hypothetical protein AN958_05918 [Leucoagaricus sp. SymC.cos]|nr:hypothetical protein AN958_05918 [Leucoagaricus sp. SymC.cos]
MPWLEEHNPKINWKEHTLKIQTPTQQYEELLETISNECLLIEDHNEELNIKMNTAMKLAQKYTKQQPDNSELIIPHKYHHYLSIFSDKHAKQFPPAQKWDHQIELLPSFELKAFLNYKLTPKEMEELDKFLNKNLEKKYIQPSKSPMASPFFFVEKKDRKL